MTNKKVNWFFAPTGKWDKSYIDKIKDCIISQGYNFYYCPYENNQYKTNHVADNIPTVFYGPIQFVKKMMHETDYQPGAFSFKDNLYCNEYMSFYPIDMFLNGDGYFTTLGILKQKGIKEEIFIRPNSPYKLFTGFTIKPEDFQIEMNSLKQIQNIEEKELVLVSSPKNILAEFRTVVSGRDIIAYSQYIWEDRTDHRMDILPECYDLVKEFIKHYSLDDIYVVDVAHTDIGPKIIELNSFSSAGWYSCDAESIIKKASELAIRKFEELY